MPQIRATGQRRAFSEGQQDVRGSFQQHFAQLCGNQDYHITSWTHISSLWKPAAIQSRIAMPTIPFLNSAIRYHPAVQDSCSMVGLESLCSHNLLPFADAEQARCQPPKPKSLNRSTDSAGEKRTEIGNWSNTSAQVEEPRAMMRGRSR